MSDLLEFLAGWDLSDGMIDTIDTVEVDRHLSVVTDHRLTGVLLAAMRAGEVEVDRPEVVVEAHEWALTHARLLDTAMLESVEILLDADITPCLLKGLAIARLLPESDERISADIDLLVPTDRLDDAASALEAVGATRSQPAMSPDWERRFAPSVTIGWRTGTELNLHRTLAPGPYGHLVDLDELAASTVTVEFDGIDVLTLRPELHLVHAALHIALGGVEPRLGDVRDLALLLERTNLDVDRVMRTIVRWGAEAPAAVGFAAAGSIGARHPIIDWAEAHRPRSRDRRLLASYADRDGRVRRQALASLTVVPWHDKPALLRSLTSRRLG
ncbi:MAG: nucleotidyltransferase family protein [Actinomycetota bacterium]|nr:nucleotidyltransferase family protein [Actinomycetota bacterium]